MRKRRIIVLISLILCVIAIALIGFGKFANSQRTVFLRKEISRIYEDLEITDIIDKIKLCESLEAVDPDLFAALADRCSDIQSENLSLLLESQSDSPVLQRVFISIAEYNGIDLSPKTVEKMLLSQSVDTTVRLDLLIYASNKGEEFDETIQNLVDDDQIAHWAIREMYTKFPEAVSILADAIINSYNGTFTSQMQGALRIKALELKTESSAKDRQQYIDLCEKIIYEDHPDDNITKNLVLNYIEAIDSWESLKYLINNKDYDQKAILSIDMQKTISDILLEAPNDEKLEIALRAIIYGPDPLYYSLLIDHKNTNASYYTENEYMNQLLEEAIHLTKN